MLSRLIPKPSHFRRFLSLPPKRPNFTLSPINPYFTVVPKRFSSNSSDNGDGKDPFSSRAWKGFGESEEKFDAFFAEESGSLAEMNDAEGEGIGGRVEKEEEQVWLQEKGLDDEDEDSIFKGIDEETEKGAVAFDDNNLGDGAQDFAPWSLKEEEEKGDVFDFHEDVRQEGDFSAVDIKPKVDVEKLQKEEQALTAVLKG